MARLIPLFVSLVVSAPALAAADGRTAVAVPVSAQTAVRIGGAHGDLSEEMWRTAPAISDFVQRDPAEGGEPSQRTEFRVAFDASTLYVKVRAFDSEPDKIVGYLTRRDADSPSDWIRVLIDSYHDRRTAYEFAVNPSAVKQDRYWFNDGNRDDSWDAVWDVSVTRDPLGWSAEFRIPFSQLRFTPGDAKTFGLAVSRQIGRLNETSTWPLLPRSATGYVSQFGDLAGLSMTQSPKRLEIVPYSVANLTNQPTGGNPLVKGSAPSGAFGADLKYALTPGLTLTTTINPDFGQVEADPAVVNLSAFETFFSERRPFFVEGSGNFRFDTDCNDGDCSGLFYSRRIGRSPQGRGDLPSGDEIFVDAPLQTTILGAAKLTGRVGRFSIGAMHAVTQQELGSVLAGPVRSRQPVEPLTDYSVGRVRREFADQSSVGFIVTATNRQVPSTLSFLANNAYTGGIDADWRFKSRYSLKGYWAASAIQGSPEAIDRIQENSRHYFQRPASPVPLDPTRTSLAGDAGQLAFAKIGGQRVRFNFNAGFKSPGYDTNDVGFMRRADQRTMSAWVQLRSDKPNRWFRSRMINFNQNANWNSSGDRLWSGQNVNSHATFANNWSVGGGYNFQEYGIDDRVTRGGPSAIMEGYKEAWYYVNSDNRRAVSFNYNGGGGSDLHGSSWFDVVPGFGFRPMSALQITASVRYSRNVTDAQWVNTVTDTADRSIFAHLNQTTVSLTGRVNYTVTPTLSLQLYAAPFVSGGGYSNFKQLIDGRNTDYARRYAPFSYDTDAYGIPDFNYRSFRTTNVMRWEYKPGSTLFAVWQQSREDTAAIGDFRFGRDFGNVFRTPARNVFLVKLAYWLNY
jgi:hypothetical protein